MGCAGRRIWVLIPLRGLGVFRRFPEDLRYYMVNNPVLIPLRGLGVFRRCAAVVGCIGLCLNPLAGIGCFQTCLVIQARP